MYHKKELNPKFQIKESLSPAASSDRKTTRMENLSGEDFVTWPDMSLAVNSNGTKEDNLTDINETCTNLYCIPDEDYIELIEEYIFPTPYEWVLISLHMTVFVVGLVGNALVCLSVYRNLSMRTVTNYFIVNLAVADFLVILICLPPTVLWDVTETWFFGSVMCKLVVYLQGVSVSVSVLTLTFISLDRWYAICFPLRFKSTTARAKTVILLIWIGSFLLVLPDVIVLETRPNPNLHIETHYLMDCTYTWDQFYTRIYQLYIVATLYVAPFLLMTVTYFQIARVLWDKNIPGSAEAEVTRRQSRSVTLNQSCRNGKLRICSVNPSCEGQIQSRQKAAKMLIAVVVIFGICYLPVHLINTLRYTIGLPQTHATSVVSLLSHWLCYANSATNPIIYNFMSAKFRKEFKNTFKCKCMGHSYRGRSRGTANTYNSRYTSSKTQCENIHLNSMRRFT
ncbi:orexin/Hypocretin receptor type 1-like [Tachypleus tridentatus]|uniref:orexin/Hypocretin receptor type 1-like n=1 Tax=Tachypleus tridentatus TaxID=6853 RepID=UPI003FD42E70